MDAIQALKTRKSVRKYTKGGVKKQDLDIIMECGTLAPTGYNKQPFAFVIIGDEGIKKSITEIHPYSEGETDAQYIIAVYSNFEDAITPIEDACAATENMMIAATALGYGTCWLQAYNKEWSKKLEEILHAPKGYQIVSLFTLGTFEDDGRRSLKKPVQQIVKYNSF